MLQKKFFVILVLSLILIIFFSCDSFNLFQTNIFQPTPKTLEKLLPEDITQLLRNLQRTDIQNRLVKSSTERNALINFLSKKIDNSNKEETILSQMALATVYAKTTDLRLVTPSLKDLSNISSGETQLFDDPRGFVKHVFENSSNSNNNKKLTHTDIANAVRNALTLYDVLNQLGENIRNNGGHFPDDFKTVSGEYAWMSLIAGAIRVLINTIESTSNTSTKILLLANYVVVTTSNTKFVATESSFSDIVLGPTSNPLGMQRIFIATNLMVLFEK